MAASNSYVALATAAGAILITAMMLVGKSKKQRKQQEHAKSSGHSHDYSNVKKDILKAILEHSAPVAAARELALSASSPANAGSLSSVHTCERLLGGRQLVITADAQVAKYIFNGPNSRNYIRRPAEDVGLEELGMLNRGLIWNNNLDSWRKIRGCFQTVLDEATLSRAAAMAREECQKLVEQSCVEKETQGSATLNMLDLCRKVTFRTTLSVFFGVRTADFVSNGIFEDGFIAAIVAYFKAWEWFLFRPKEARDTELLAQHRASVWELQQHVRKLLETKPYQTDCANEQPSHNPDDPVSRKKKKNKPLFVDLLRQACAQESDANEARALLEQSALEMLLAGTDTSSVTAYYALLGLAGDAVLQKELRTALLPSDHKTKSPPPLLRSLVDETLRFKPVGPVVLRQAVQADPDFSLCSDGIQLQAGAAILVHLAEMNLRDEYWGGTSRQFRPKRFLSDNVNKSKTFFPFGDGSPKGCIGSHLGRREVNAIVETVVVRYNMELDAGADSLSSLDTHWDIANQPDEPALIRLMAVCSV